MSPHLIVHIRGGTHKGFTTKNRRFDSLFRILLHGGAGAWRVNIFITLNCCGIGAPNTPYLTYVKVAAGSR